ncbi:hypothetical protein [Tumebacillus flagellatus]|uniref:Uncharacterized protein n=1 Tax=Tumebacillus flagellatus TaxID=1157490 RepID=A0A074LLT4_9BACL|nr:hypothetical protein [Tumebacillus flagellatus]KEO82044.1 hypothetical protein EL26_17915 [Tumebacillus flagellatus]
MRRQTVRSLASITIWIGGVELFASFLSKMIFDYRIPYSEVFIGLLILGLVSWVLTTLFYWKQ